MAGRPLRCVRCRRILLPRIPTAAEINQDAAPRTVLFGAWMFNASNKHNL
jgi:hypothetical protein